MNTGPPSRESIQIMREKGITSHDEEIASAGPGHPGHDYAGDKQDEDSEPEIHWK